MYKVRFHYKAEPLEPSALPIRCFDDPAAIFRRGLIEPTSAADFDWAACLRLFYFLPISAMSPSANVPRQLR